MSACEQEPNMLQKFNAQLQKQKDQEIREALLSDLKEHLNENVICIQTSDIETKQAVINLMFDNDYLCVQNETICVGKCSWVYILSFAKACSALKFVYIR